MITKRIKRRRKSRIGRRRRKYLFHRGMLYSIRAKPFDVLVAMGIFLAIVLALCYMVSNLCFSPRTSRESMERIRRMDDAQKERGLFW